MKPLTGGELCKLLERHGWELRRITASHHIFKKEGHRENLSVPVHSNSSLKSGTQRTLLRLAGIEPE